MRKIILWIVSLPLCTPMVSAGTSKEDPYVRKLRAEFLRAVTPSHADLRLGRKWDCTFYSAQSGNFSQGSSPSFCFTLERRCCGQTDRLWNTMSDNDVAREVFEAMGEQGMASGLLCSDAIRGLRPTYTAIRYSSADGALLFENIFYASFRSSPYGDLYEHAVEPSVFDPKNYAVTIGKCLPKE